MSAHPAGTAGSARRQRTRTPEGAPTRETIDALPEVLTKDQAAWLMQLSPLQLQAAARRGEVPCSTFGRTMRFSKSVLMSRLEGRER